MDDNITIGSRIKKRRLELNLKLTAIYDKKGISTGSLSEIENGKKLPSANTLISLSEILNCSVDWILTGNSLIKEKNFSSNEKECFDELEYDLVNKYRLLDSEDKEEILLLINLKYSRTLHQKGTTSYRSEISDELGAVNKVG